VTTNAIDRKQLVIASDSRWSYVENGYLIYVDDVDFDKIVWRQSGAMICAGSGVLIDAWRSWFLAPMPSLNAPPTEFLKPNGETESLMVTVFQARTGAVLFSCGWYLPFDDVAYFAGTGAEHAHRCFSNNRCAKRAVQSAAQDDPCTGGATKFVELVSGTHNLSPVQKSLNDIVDVLLTKGKAMNLTTKNVVSFAEYAAAPGQASGARPSASNLSAPTGQVFRQWTDEDKKRLVDAVRTMVVDEEQAND